MSRRLRVARLFLWLIVSLPALLWATPLTSLNPRALLPDMVDGTAYRPYVRRVVVPALAHMAESALGEPGRAALGSWLERHPRVASRLKWPADRAGAFAAVFVLHALSLLLFAAAFHRLVLATWQVGEGMATLASVAALVLIPLHFGYQNFVYDFPALALFTAGLWALYERRWGWFLALWPIGLLNKETYVLLLPLFALHARGWMTPRTLWKRVALLVAIAAVVGGALIAIFHRNPGGAVEWQLARNLRYHPKWNQIRRDVAYVAFWVFAFWGAGAKRVVARDAVLVLAALFAFTFFLGFIGEWRDFYEAYPLGLLLAVHTALRLIGREPRWRLPPERGLAPAAGPVRR